jgi:hypothetical protein
MNPHFQQTPQYVVVTVSFVPQAMVVSPCRDDAVRADRCKESLRAELRRFAQLRT